MMLLGCRRGDSARLQLLISKLPPEPPIGAEPPAKGQVWAKVGSAIVAEQRGEGIATSRLRPQPSTATRLGGRIRARP